MNVFNKFTQNIMQRMYFSSRLRNKFHLNSTVFKTTLFQWALYLDLGNKYTERNTRRDTGGITPPFLYNTQSGKRQSDWEWFWREIYDIEQWDFQHSKNITSQFDSKTWVLPRLKFDYIFWVIVTHSSHYDQIYERPGLKLWVAVTLFMSVNDST